MKVKDFYELVEQIREPEASLLPNLYYRTRKYPFFQPDIYLYIKCLYLSSSEDFADELTRLAPFVSDRKALFYYVMDDRYKQFRKRVEKNLTPDRTRVLIDAFFEALNEPDLGTELPGANIVENQNMATSDYFAYLEIVEKKQANETDILGIDEGFLTLNSFVPIDGSDEGQGSNNDIAFNASIDQLEVEDDDIPLLKHHEIIDRFLEKAASEESLHIKIEPTGEELSEDELDNTDPPQTKQELENDYFFTQTLANIYIKQKKYKRAYEIIKHLSLNYPEKNIYFADQLSFLEKLIKNLK
jgi:hypothetical protein